MKACILFRSGVIALAALTVGSAQTPTTTGGVGPYIQNYKAKRSLGLTRGRLINPDFKMTFQDGSPSLVANKLVIQAKAQENGTFLASKRIPIPDLPPGTGPSSVLLSRATGITCLRDDFYYRLEENTWQKIGVVPNRLAWNFRWGSTEVLDDGSLLFITGSQNKLELVTPGNWKAAFSVSYGERDGNLRNTPTPYREPVSVRVDNKVLIFYPFSVLGEILLFDGGDHSIRQVPSPWDKTSRTILTAANGKRYSDRPAIAQWFPIDSNTVGFQGVNGDAWYGYFLDLKTLTWKTWEFNHQGWNEPYGVPTDKMQLLNIDHF